MDLPVTVGYSQPQGPNLLKVFFLLFLIISLPLFVIFFGSKIGFVTKASNPEQSYTGIIVLRSVSPSNQILPRSDQIYFSDLSYRPVSYYKILAREKIFTGLPNKPLMFSVYLEVPGFGNLDFTANNNGIGYLPQSQTLDVIYEVAKSRIAKIESLISTYNGSKLVDFRSRLGDAKQKLALADQMIAGTAEHSQRSLESLSIGALLGEDLVVEISKDAINLKNGLAADQNVSIFTQVNEASLSKTDQSIFDSGVIGNIWQSAIKNDTTSNHVYNLPYYGSDFGSEYKYRFPTYRNTAGVWLNSLPSWMTKDANGIAKATTSLVDFHVALAKSLPGINNWQIISEPHSWDDQGFITSDNLINMGKSISTAIKSINTNARVGINVALPWGEDAAQNLYRSVEVVPLCQYWSDGNRDHSYSTGCLDNITGYKLEQNVVSGYILPKQENGTVRLCQYWSDGNRDHSYSTGCQDNVLGYKLEDNITVGYVYPIQVSGTVRLCQYWSDGNRDHSYSTGCQDNVLGYKLEDNITVGYVYPQKPKFGPQVLSPMAFLEKALAQGLNYDFIVIQMYPSGRDLLEHEMLLDEYKKLGKPIHIELEASASNSAMPGYSRTEFCSNGDCRHPSQKYYSWRGGWSEGVQAFWLQSMFYTLMSKDYVKEFNWWDAKDSQSVYLPWGGLVDKDGIKRQSYITLKNLVNTYNHKIKTSRLPFTQYWSDQNTGHMYAFGVDENIGSYKKENFSSGFVYGLPAFESAAQIPLCQFWSGQNKDYMFEECNKSFPGYVNEKIAAYIPMSLTFLYKPGEITPVCRYWSEGNKDHLYSSYCQDKIAGYVMENSGNPSFYLFSSPNE